MFKIKKTNKLKTIIDRIKNTGYVCLGLQIMNYAVSIIFISITYENKETFFSIMSPILICNLVVPAALTLLLIIIYTLIMIFMYLTGSFDKLKIQIIDVDEENGNDENNENNGNNGNNENNIYSPFNVYIIILMGILYFWMILSPTFAGLFIWCISIIPSNQFVFVFFLILLLLTSITGFIFLLANIICIIGVLTGCMKTDNMSTISNINNFPVIPIATFSNDPNTNAYGHQIRFVAYQEKPYFI